jgi:hypothetical protein
MTGGRLVADDVIAAEENASTGSPTLPAPRVDEQSHAPDGSSGIDHAASGESEGGDGRSHAPSSADATGGGAGDEPDAGPLFKNRDYLLWFGGTSLSRLGSALSSIALPLILLAITHSAAAAGAVQACFFLAFVLVSLPGGLIADRFPRKRLLAGSALVDFAAVTTVAVVASQGHVYVAQVCVVAVVQGASSALYSATQTPALVRIVGKRHISGAMAAGQMREALLSLLAGPPLGILLFCSPSRCRFRSPWTRPASSP